MIAIKRSISFGVEVKKKPETAEKKNKKPEGRVRCVIKNSNRELLNLINSFGEVAGYKINSNKSMAFLYTKDKQADVYACARV